MNAILLKIIKPLAVFALAGFTISPVFSDHHNESYDYHFEEESSSSTDHHNKKSDQDYPKRVVDKAYPDAPAGSAGGGRMMDRAYPSVPAGSAGGSFGVESVTQYFESACDDDRAVCEDESYQEENRVRCRQCVVIQNSNIELNITPPFSMDFPHFPGRIYNDYEIYEDEHYWDEDNVPGSSSSYDEGHYNDVPVPELMPEEAEEYGIVGEKTGEPTESDHLVKREYIKEDKEDKCYSIYQQEYLIVKYCSKLSDDEVSELFRLNSILRSARYGKLFSVEPHTFEMYLRLSPRPFMNHLIGMNPTKSNALLRWIAKNELVAEVMAEHDNDSISGFLNEIFLNIGINENHLNKRITQKYNYLNHIENFADIIVSFLKFTNSDDLLEEWFNKALYEQTEYGVSRIVYFCDIAEHLSTEKWKQWGDTLEKPFIEETVEYLSEKLGKEYDGVDEYNWRTALCPDVYSHWRTPSILLNPSADAVEATPPVEEATPEIPDKFFFKEKRVEATPPVEEATPPVEEATPPVDAVEATPAVEDEVGATDQ